jgi:hypothetical protein
MHDRAHKVMPAAALVGDRGRAMAKATTGAPLGDQTNDSAFSPRFCYGRRVIREPEA